MTVAKTSFFSYLLIMSYLLDPQGIVLRLKLPALILFFVWCFLTNKKIDIHGFMLVCVYYFILLMATLNMFINDYLYDTHDMLTYYTSPLYLFVLLFISDRDIDIINPCIVSAFIISFLTIIIVIIANIFPGIILLLEQVEFIKGMFKIDDNVIILGYSFFRVFHLSSPILVIALGYSLAHLLNKNTDTIGYLFKCILFSVAIFFSSTRANMLAGILIVLLIYLYHILFTKKNLFFFVFVTGCVVVLAFVVIFLLFNDKSNASSGVKYNHAISLIELFKSSNNIFLFGNGPGSLYYTRGFGKFTTRSELSYYELIRTFGLFSSIVVCIIYFYPIFSISRKNIYSFSFCISYLAYLFIAGTNPLLIVPQGFTMLLLAYNYINNDRKQFHKK